MAHRVTKEFRVIFLDNRNVMIRYEGMGRGTVNAAPVYPREIVKRALELGASAVILVHNHPSGDPSPSRDDIAMTKSVIEAGRHLGLAVHDHVVIGKEPARQFPGFGTDLGATARDTRPHHTRYGHDTAAIRAVAHAAPLSAQMQKRGGADTPPRRSVDPEPIAASKAASSCRPALPGSPSALHRGQPSAQPPHPSPTSRRAEPSSHLQTPARVTSD
jgi:hypothetical protein